jgi:hypothetical protein
MASIEEVISDLKKLTPEQVEQVARLVHGLAQPTSSTTTPGPSVPAYLVDDALRHGWPPELFSKVIGSLPDLERAPQPSPKDRAGM